MMRCNRLSWQCSACKPKVLIIQWADKLTIQASNSSVSSVITSNIMSHLDKNKILFQNQHGFRSRVSCETQLIQFTQDLYDTLNQKGQADVIVMDFSKAFDKVDHQRLLLKLHRLGINTSVITWIQSLLSNRSQSVVLDGEHSRLLSSLVRRPSGLCFGTVPLSYVHQ